MSSDTKVLNSVSGLSVCRTLCRVQFYRGLLIQTNNEPCLPITTVNLTVLDGRHLYSCMTLPWDVNGSTLLYIVWISLNVHRVEQQYVAVFYKTWVVSNEILFECSSKMSEISFWRTKTFFPVRLKHRTRYNRNWKNWTRARIYMTR